MPSSSAATAAIATVACNGRSMTSTSVVYSSPSASPRSRVDEDDAAAVEVLLHDTAVAPSPLRWSPRRHRAGSGVIATIDGLVAIAWWTPTACRRRRGGAALRAPAASQDRVSCRSGRRDRTESLDVGLFGGRRSLFAVDGAVPCDHGDCGRNDRHHHQHCGHSEQLAQATVLLPVLRRCSVALSIGLGRSRHGRVDPFHLVVVQDVETSCGQFGRGHQATTACEFAMIAARPPPGCGGVGDDALSPKVVAVVVEPLAKSRPIAQQRLVGHFDRRFTGGVVAIEGEQASRRECVEEPRRPLGLPNSLRAALAGGCRPTLRRA